MKNLLFTIIFFVSSLGSVQSQNTILGRPYYPVDFDRPIDLFDNPSRLSELYKNDSKKSSSKAWAVISDRDDNPTYDRPNGNKLKTINFRDYFYVTEERGEWIRIAKGRSNGLQLASTEDFGWVQKSKMLLWTTGLVNERTGIHEKTFLLNKAEDIDIIVQLEKKEIVPLYRGPQTGTKAENLYIYKFFFVYKKENNKYLIGSEYITSNYNVERVLVGWVSEQRCADWNTRICVEPNFTPAAFTERKSNPNLRLIAYKERGAARLQATSGVVTNNQIYFDQDPCKGNVLTANDNTYRYPGSVVRYPLLSSTDASSDFFRTGVIGEIKIKESDGSLDFITTQEWAKMFEKYKIENKKFENFDVLFVIEGTDALNENKESIIKGIESALDQLKEIKNVRIGALIYRDPINSKGNRFCELKKMTPISLKNDVVSWVRNTPFSSFGEQDPYTGMYYGLNKAITESDLTDLHTNIIFLIGNNADFKADAIRKSVAEGNNDPALLDASSVIDNLTHLNAHLYVMQCKNNDDRSSEYFMRQAHNFILENSKSQYNNYADLKKHYPNLGMEEPFLDKLETSNRIDLMRSAIPGALMRPSLGGALNTAQISSFISDCVKKSVEHLKNTNEDLVGVIEKGDQLTGSVSAGSFSPGILPILKELIQKSGISNEAARNLADFKYQLYAEVYVPKRVKKAQYPTCSYVLFMPERDLADYVNTLERFENSLGDGNYYDRRQRLFEAMWDLVKRFSGNPNMPREEGERLSLNQFTSLIQGVQGEGLELVDKAQQNILLGDITQETSLSNTELDAFINRIVDKKNKLKRILLQNKNYEFSYTTGDEVYFWIPVEDSF